MRRARVALLVLGLAPAAAAQQEGGGLLLSASGGYFGINSRDTARAVFDKTGGSVYGGEVAYVFGEHLFLAAGARSFSKTGQRVFVAEPGGTVFKLGFPLKLELVPAQATLGWRLSRKRLFGIPFTPYLGVGGGVTSYREESTVAGEVRKYSVSKASGHALIGLELGSGHWRFGVETGYSSVPNAIGDGADGVSKVYSETDVGGFTVLGKVVFSLRK